MLYVKPISAKKPSRRLTDPPGVMPLSDEDRKPVIRLTGGDSLVMSTTLTVPGKASEGGTPVPAAPDNSIVVFALSEDKYADPIWVGRWMDGICPAERGRGLVSIRVPDSVTRSLRRGSYSFSVRVSDALMDMSETQAAGDVVVDYSPSGPHHSVPYADGTAGREGASVDISGGEMT